MARPQKTRNRTYRKVRAVHAIRADEATARRATRARGLQPVPAADDATSPTDSESR